MKNAMIFLLGGLTGGVIGSIATYSVLTRKYKEDLERQYAEMESLDGYLRQDHSEDEDDDVVNPIEDSADYEPLSNGERTQLHAEIGEKAGRTDYKNVYKPNMTNDILKKEQLLAELQYPQDDPPEEEPELEKDISAADEETAEKMFRTRQRDKHRAPRIISRDKLEELDETYEDVTLCYYTEDDILSTEEDEIIDEPGNILGDALTKYGFKDSDEQLIFVQNFDTHTVYEIQKIFGAYSDYN